MNHVFVSYVEEDEPTVLEIVHGLEGARFQTWYYKRDCVPGISYLNSNGASHRGIASRTSRISP